MSTAVVLLLPCWATWTADDDDDDDGLARDKDGEDEEAEEGCDVEGGAVDDDVVVVRIWIWEDDGAESMMVSVSAILFVNGVPHTTQQAIIMMAQL